MTILSHAKAALRDAKDSEELASTSTGKWREYWKDHAAQRLKSARFYFREYRQECNAQ